MTQMTDDSIDNIRTELADWIENRVGFPIWESDEAYESFTELVNSLLEPYSNGYRNYN